MCLSGAAILVAISFEYILNMFSSIESPLNESSSVTGFPGLRIKRTIRWNSHGGISGAFSPNSRSFPTLSSMEDMCGNMNLRREFVMPSGPGELFFFRSLTIFLNSSVVTKDSNFSFSSGGHFLDVATKSGPRNSSILKVLAIGSIEAISVYLLVMYSIISSFVSTLAPLGELTINFFISLEGLPVLAIAKWYAVVLSPLRA